jgi:hypothetical protein
LMTFIFNKYQIFFKLGWCNGFFLTLWINPWVKVWHYRLQKRGYLSTTAQTN